MSFPLGHPNPNTYGYWETWLGVQQTGATLSVKPMLGNLPNTDLYIPVIRPFTTFRVSIISQAVAAPATNWIVTLYKNNVAAAFANGYTFGAAPATALRTQLWVDISGNQLPVSFARSDYWGITMAGPSVTDPKVTLVMDMFSQFQGMGGPHT